MINKVINVAAVLIIILTTILWFYNDKKEYISELKIYCVKTNYAYLNTSDKIKMTVYLNSNNNILKYKDENSFYLNDYEERTTLTLNISSVQVSDKQRYNNETYYPYVLIFDNLILDNSVTLDRCFLNISNSNYKAKIEVGTFEYKIKEEDTLNIDYQSMYGVYNIINEQKLLVGISIKIVNKDASNITLGVKSGGKIVIDNKKIKEADNVLNESNIFDYIKDYKLILEDNNENFTIKANSSINYLIPISYKTALFCENSYLIFQSGNLTYTINNFYFQAKVISLNDYSQLVIKGKINSLVI